jgi:hypothetical protein
MLLLGGCGSDISSQNEDYLPHQSLKSNRIVNLETDWTWFVDMKRDTSDTNLSKLTLRTLFYEGLPQEVGHLQFFLDTDNNDSTGFSGENGWVIKGADYLIEDGKLFRAKSTNQWQWDYIGTFSRYQKREQTDKTAEIVIESNNPKISKLFQTENKIDVSIEPYNADWQGIYDTIYPIQINPLNQNSSYEALLRKLLGDDFISLILLPNSQNAIVNHIDNGYKTYSIFDFSDPKNPKQDQIIAQEEQDTTIAYLHLIDDTRLEYIRQTGEDRFKIIYDYETKKVVEEHKIEPINPETIRNELIKDNYASSTDMIKYLLTPNGKYLFIVVNNEKYLLYSVIEEDSIKFAKELKNIIQSAESITMLDDHTLSYTITVGRYRKRTTYIYDYLKDQEIRHYITTEDKINYFVRHNHTFYLQSLYQTIFTPSRSRIAVYAGFRGEHRLYLYDVTDPDNITKTGMLRYDNEKAHFRFKDINFLDDQTLTFIAYEVTYDSKNGQYLPTGVAYKIVYDVQNNREISKEKL